MAVPSERESGSPKFLFLTRSASVAGLQEELRKRAVDAVFSPTKGRQPTLEGYRRFSLSEYSRLRKRLSDGAYDFVVAYAPAEPLIPSRGFILKRWARGLRKVVREFSTLGPALTPRLLEGVDIPLVVYEWDDTTVVQRKHWPLLNRASTYFKVNCPTNPLKAFQFQDRRNDDVFNIVRQPKYVDWAKKIHPISLGGPDDLVQEGGAAPEKRVDVFFAGALEYSPVRSEGLRLLNQLASEGIRVDCPAERLPREEFFRRCSEAWLVWAPEGAEWDTHRAYEAALSQSVPLLNYPTTRRYRPLVEGKHAFYYGVEGDHLLEVVRNALGDKARLRRMAEEARRHACRYHIHSALADLIVEAGAREGIGKVGKQAGA